MVTKQKINSPLLYRLLDEDPDKQQEKISHRFIDINGLHEDIRHNLEMILNTRFCGLDWPEHLSELKQSVLNYGIIDFSQTYFNNKNTQLQLCRNIREVLEHFEPRLQSVKVTLLNDELELDRVLKIKIEGILNIEPSPIPTVFESCLDITKQKFDFSKEDL